MSYLPQAASRAAWLRVSALVLAGSLLLPHTAHAVICTNAGAGANSGTDNGIATATACGLNADASGADSSAYGLNSQASGTASSAYGVGSTASGESSSASGNQSLASGNVSSAFGTLSTASANGSSAYGAFSTASGSGSSAYGTSSLASGFNSSAYGFDSAATGVSSVAIGDVAQAGGDNSIAIGKGASAPFANSAAFGAGATAKRADQQVFGTASNTYTAPGITSAASKAAQGAPTHVVTTNPTGDLAAHTPAELGLARDIDLTVVKNDITVVKNDITVLQKQINVLIDRDRQHTAGIAVAMALHDPDLVAGEKFGLRLNWGNYDGSNAMALTAAGVLGWNVFSQGDRLAVSGGLGWGLDQSQIGGRVGVQLTWK